MSLSLVVFFVIDGSVMRENCQTEVRICESRFPNGPRMMDEHLHPMSNRWMPTAGPKTMARWPQQLWPQMALNRDRWAGFWGRLSLSSGTL